MRLRDLSSLSVQSFVPWVFWSRFSSLPMSDCRILSRSRTMKRRQRGSRKRKLRRATISLTSFKLGTVYTLIWHARHCTASAFNHTLYNDFNAMNLICQVLKARLTLVPVSFSLTCLQSHIMLPSIHILQVFWLGSRPPDPPFVTHIWSPPPQVSAFSRKLYNVSDHPSRLYGDYI